jgi:SAM-dependent methyltransferase
MTDTKEIAGLVRRLYVEGEFTKEHPNFDESDSQWKVQQLIPFVDEFMCMRPWKRIRLLDVGGGAGIILRDVAQYIRGRYEVEVSKNALDLSPQALELQQSRNPDIALSLCQDITSCSIEDKGIDLVLMIDVLEHVPDPIRALHEISRLAEYAILKVPIEDTIVFRLWNIARRGEPKRKLQDGTGHLNFYTRRRFLIDLEKHAGFVISSRLTNVFDYCLHSRALPGDIGGLAGVKNRIASVVFSISPILCSLIFPSDFIIVLIACR